MRSLTFRLTLLTPGCSIQDELFGSFEQLLALADEKGAKYDRCVPCLAAASCHHFGSSFHINNSVVQICAGEFRRGRAAEHQRSVQ